MKLILRWLLLAAALLFVAYIYDGVSVQSFQSALLAAFVIGLLNTFVRRLQRHWLHGRVDWLGHLLGVELFDQHGCG
jgi:hypothetical protein